MKNIRIKVFNRPDLSNVNLGFRKYSVSLGNGCKLYFDSQRATLKFLAETNIFLNSKLHECNYIYSLMLTEMRQAWLYSLPPEERKLAGCIADVEKGFNSIVHVSGINQNQFVFLHFQTVTRAMSQMAEYIIIIYRSRKYYGDIQRIMHLQRQIKKASEELASFGIVSNPV